MAPSKIIEKKLNTCIICCDQVYQATSLSMCLHTFCWKCIYDKITKHNWKCCLVCYANLGANPVKQLRPNHLLESLKSKILSPNQEDVETETDTKSERTLTDADPETETDSERTISDSETETESERTVMDSNMKSKYFEVSSLYSTNLEVVKPLIGKSSGKMNLPSISGVDKEVNIDDGDPTSFVTERRAKHNFPEMEDAQQGTTSTTPIWFTLFASNHQDSNAPLPQIPCCYLRVKNRNLQVSYIKKYITMKLNLESEDEVELYLRTQRLDSSMMLHNLLDYWIKTIPDAEKNISTRVGCSGASYVMVLCYTRKSQRVP